MEPRRARSTNRIVTTLALLALVLVPLAEAGPIRIATSEKVGKGTARNFAPLLKHLNGYGTRSWQYQVDSYSTPETLVEDFKNGKIDVALLGPVLYVKAHHELGAQAIVADGPKYNSVVFVRNDSPVKTVDELKGRSFAFGYRDSTSSHLFPLLLLSRARIKETDLGDHEFVGNHDLVIEGVLSGRFEAGGVINAAFEASKGKGLRAIAVSDPIPGVPVVVRKDADKVWLEEFRAAMLAYKAPTKDNNEPFGRGVVAVTDSDYNQIRFLCKVVLGEVYR